MDMRFGTWNVRSMYRAGSLRAVVAEISKYKLDLVGVQEVRWDRGGTELAGRYTFFCGKRNENHELGTRFFVHKGNISAVKRVDFVSDRMSYIILKSPCCDIIILNVHVPTEDKIDDIKDRFCEELEHLFDKFPSLLDVRSFRAADCDTDQYLVVTKVRKRLAVSKQTMYRVHMEKFNLKKVNEVEGKEQYRVEISNRFAALDS
jgi:hypothetical protein